MHTCGTDYAWIRQDIEYHSDNQEKVRARSRLSCPPRAEDPTSGQLVVACWSGQAALGVWMRGFTGSKGRMEATGLGTELCAEAGLDPRRGAAAS